VIDQSLLGSWFVMLKVLSIMNEAQLHSHNVHLHPAGMQLEMQTHDTFTYLPVMSLMHPIDVCGITHGVLSD
jgi:hypothetical protein